MLTRLLAILLPTPTDQDYLGEVLHAYQWDRLTSRPAYHTVARTESVKFIIDLRDEDRTYFLNSRRWATHLDFVRAFLNPRVDSRTFLISEYKREDRRFVLGSVMHYLDSGHWTLELDGGDTLSPTMIEWMYLHIAKRFLVTRSLRFRPLSPCQISYSELLASSVPSISRDAINSYVKYQPVVLGTAFGYLRLVKEDTPLSSLRPYDVVVSASVPIEIPPIAALVTDQLQAPLAHVAVLSRNRNTPDMALIGASTMREFRELSGALVKLTVGAQDYSIEIASSAEAEESWKTVRPVTPYCPEADFSHRGLVRVSEMGSGANRFAGSKAAQVADLTKLEGITTPGGFVVPFSAYASHLQSAGLDEVIDSLLSSAEFRQDAAAREAQLAQLRAAVSRHEVDLALVREIMTFMKGFPSSARAIFRSSTNAEDLPGFNGAGLYESVPVPSQASPNEIASALREVWASVWLMRAYEEREWYRISHGSVAMAVLVQPFVEGAIATGVAITGNPFKPSSPAVFINSQIAGSTVTGAAGNELPEQYLVATWAGEYEPELLGRSSLTGGQPILTEADVLLLTKQLVRIHGAMQPSNAKTSNAMDVEFALTTDRKFVMLQARPYNIVYSMERAPVSRTPLRRDKDLLGRIRTALFGVLQRILG